MKAFSLIALSLLTSCTTVPVGSVALCVGVCRFTIDKGEAASPASKIGGGLAEILAQKFGTK